MAFTFIHTADWQLGAPFASVPSDISALLQAERLNAIDRIAAVAIAKHAAHVLVAGDVFDDVRPPQSLIGKTLARLAKYQNLTWHFISGNHDPAAPGSVWDDLKRQAPGPHIRLYLNDEPVEVAPGVLLLPAPLAARAMSTDPTACMDRAPSAPGMLRIGIAHGSVRGFSSEGEAAIPIAIDRAKTARLDYLALGDWHGTVRIDQHTWYSGTPEPDRYRDNHAGNVLAITIAKSGSPPIVEQISTATFQWRQEALALSSPTQIDELTATLRTSAIPSDRTLLKLSLTGRVSLAEGTALEQSIATLTSALAHLELDRDALTISTAESDLEALGSGAIADVAAELLAQARTGDMRQQAIAQRALQLLTLHAGAAR
jgi:DNA repair exonuclease SbcCD nuclease subunit